MHFVQETNQNTTKFGDFLAETPNYAAVTSEVISNRPVNSCD
jgi:hypothetical protein